MDEKVLGIQDEVNLLHPVSPELLIQVVFSRKMLDMLFRVGYNSHVDHSDELVCSSTWAVTKAVKWD